MEHLKQMYPGGGGPLVSMPRPRPPIPLPPPAPAPRPPPRPAPRPIADAAAFSVSHADAAPLTSAAMEGSALASPSAAPSAPAAPGATYVMFRRGGGFLNSVPVGIWGGGTYTVFFTVVEPTSDPTAASWSRGTRLAMTDVFFHTSTASSSYSSLVCAFVSWSSMA